MSAKDRRVAKAWHGAPKKAHGSQPRRHGAEASKADLRLTNEKAPDAADAERLAAQEAKRIENRKKRAAQSGDRKREGRGWIAS